MPESINNGRGNALLVKLQGVIQALDGGNTNQAVNKMDAFISQVEAMLNAGTIPFDDGQVLLVEAELILLLMLV